MAKLNEQYPHSLQKRFSDWLKDGYTGLDRDMVRQESSFPQEAAGKEEGMDVFLQKAQRDRMREKDLYERIHRWSVTKGEKRLRLLYRFLSVLICGGIVFFLLRTVSVMPSLGSPYSPVNNEVSLRYIGLGPQETGAVNFVSGMILDYRAFDTLGESTVLFIASCAVMTLLRWDGTEKERPAALRLTTGDFSGDMIVRASAALLIPIITLLGVSTVLNGHSSPGGGFAGGAIIGGALILFRSAAGTTAASRRITGKGASLLIFSALMFYAGAKSLVFYTGANGIPLHLPLGRPFSILSAGLILPLDICVGLIVSLTMYGFYCMFTKGGY